MQLEQFLDVINNSYLNTYNTILLGGYDEPFYIPVIKASPAQIQFRYDYFRSALHELAHWCIAGEARRKLHDYGYWYEPDGRTTEQQSAFFSCEVKPQAVEWGLAMVCDVPFDVSVDNLNHQVSGVESFKSAVKQQSQHYAQKGFPSRSEQLMGILLQQRFGDTSVDLFFSQFV